MDIDLPAFWQWMQEGKDGVRFANVASTVGFGIGLVGLLIALKTYRKNSADAAFAHMHSLFREYLTKSSGGARLPAGHSFQFYVLEEMVVWLNKFWWPFGVINRDDRRAWRQTIRNHLLLYPDAIKKLKTSHGSYGKPFLRFVRTALREKTEFLPGDRESILEAIEGALHARATWLERFFCWAGGFLTTRAAAKTSEKPDPA